MLIQGNFLKKRHIPCGKILLKVPLLPLNRPSENPVAIGEQSTETRHNGKCKHVGIHHFALSTLATLRRSFALLPHSDLVVAGLVRGRRASQVQGQHED